MIHIRDTSVSLHSPNFLWDSVYSRGTVVFSSEDTGFSGLNMIEQSTADGWRPTTLPATASVTLAAEEFVDSVGFVRHTLGSTGSTVEIEWWDGAAWVTEETVSPDDDSTLVVFFQRRYSSIWRLTISGTTPPFIGAMIMGSRLAVPGRVASPHTPLQLSDAPVLLGADQSVNGNFLPKNIQRTSGRSTIGFWPQDPEFIKGDFEAFRQHFNNGKAFFACPAPVHDPRNLGYCWIGGRPMNPSHQGAVNMGVSMEVVVYNG